MRYFPLPLLLIALLSELASSAATAAPAPPPTCALLREQTASPRWLSLPGSRLVVNPFSGKNSDPAAAPLALPEQLLALDVAYYAGPAATSLPALCFLQQLRPGSGAAVVPGPRIPLVEGGWSTEGVEARFANGAARLTPADAYGAITRSVTVDLDRTPTLLVQCSPGSPAFDLKVNDGTQPVDTFLRPTHRFGASAVDVAAATGWHGVRTFLLRLFALGKGRPTTFTSVQFAALPGAAAALPETWMPGSVTARAQVGAAEIAGTTQMPDVNTVSVRYRVEQGQPGPLVLAGTFPGAAKWDGRTQTLLLQSERCHAIVTVSRPARWLGLRAAAPDWLLSTAEPQGGPPGESAPPHGGIWRLAVSGLAPGADLVVTVRFFPGTGTPGPAALAAARASATEAAFAAALARGEAEWNRRIARAPRPLDFTVRPVSPKGVTAAQVERAYYRAWVFFLADSLPPMPENSFPFPQFCAGKPSLWDGGAPHSEATAEWDSAMAMQALALLDPIGVQRALEGLLGQVEADGYLPGELLPAVLAQTLWMDTVQSGDTAALRRLYPALKRFLIWRIASPRWVYPNKSRADVKPATIKSNEFVLHEIVEMQYAERIANELAMPEEARFWREQRQAASSDFVRWFWQTPDGPVSEEMDPVSGWRGGLDIPWVLKGLQLGGDLLPEREGKSLLAIFDRTFAPAKAFGGVQNRFGDIEPVFLGLLSYGRIAEARQLAAAALRDVTRAREYSEQYSSADPPRPDGVRPSSFGARVAIDSALWHNGLILDQGLPVIIGMPGAAGVDNIPVRGEMLSVRFNERGTSVTLSGTALHSLAMPAGFHRAGAGWTGPIQEGGRIALAFAAH